MTYPTTWTTDDWYNAPLSLVGLLALANIDTIARRTALTGTSTWLDSLVICPGLHRQHDAPNLAHGEYPACAAMTTGYVFRIENPATVYYLQSVGETGRLTTLSASETSEELSTGFRVEHLAAALTLLAIAWAASLRDWSALSFLLMLILVRSINAMVIRSQARIGWHGQSEPGKSGDLFILLSYDRWIRIRGKVDSLKAITSGRWLHRPTISEEVMTGCASLLAYLSPTLAVNATQSGHIAIAAVLLANAGLLGLANHFTKGLHMKGKVLQIEGGRKVYKSRNVLAGELISESGRVDWALAMGLIPASNDKPADSPINLHYQRHVTF